MKIGIYDPYLDDCGGGEKYMMTIAHCLSRDHNVFIFWDKKADLQRVADRFSLDLSRVECVPNIFSPTTGVLTRYIKSKKYDAIIFLSDGSLPFVGTRLFVHVQQPLAQFQYNTIKDRIKIARITRFFCNSYYTKQFIGKKFDIKTSVLYPPVLLNPQKVTKMNMILHVGRFRVQDALTGIKDYKKQGVMIRAFQTMIDQGLKEWKFVIAVSVLEQDKKAFEEMKKSAYGYPIEFVINQENKALWKLYSEAKIYWHASGHGEDLKKHPEAAEHFGISTVEAMGAGVVPVVINAGGQKEIVTDRVNGMLWDTLEELQEKTLELMNNKSLWSELSHAAIKRADYFAGDRFCEDVSRLIKIERI